MHKIPQEELPLREPIRPRGLTRRDTRKANR